MFLKKAYGRSVMTGGLALLMVLSMIINESLVARTFGAYVMQAVDRATDPMWVPLLAVLLIAVVFAVNVATNAVISRVAVLSAVLKVGGVLAFALVALRFTDFSFRPSGTEGAIGTDAGAVEGFIAAVALGILAYKGFTTITNSGSELKNPERNIGRAIIISLAICLVVYLLVSWAVGSTLSIEQIATARDYALAEASRPALGRYGAWFTIAVAIVATASGLLASVFVVSRMLAMLTKMELIPHRHLGMTGHLQTHMLVYTCVAASLLAAFFDLGRIAALGAIFYLLMDIGIHWGLLRQLKGKVAANPAIQVVAMVLDALLLGVSCGSRPARNRPSWPGRQAVSRPSSCSSGSFFGATSIRSASDPKYRPVISVRGCHPRMNAVGLSLRRVRRSCSKIDRTFAERTVAGSYGSAAPVRPNQLLTSRLHRISIKAARP